MIWIEQFFNILWWEPSSAHSWGTDLYNMALLEMSCSWKRLGKMHVHLYVYMYLGIISDQTRVFYQSLIFDSCPIICKILFQVLAPGFTSTIAAAFPSTISPISPCDMARPCSLVALAQPSFCACSFSHFSACGQIKFYFIKYVDGSMQRTSSMWYVFLLVNC